MRDKVDEATKDLDFDKTVYEVHFETTAGDIRVELYPEVAPNHCKNIIGLAKIGFYDGIQFHRVIPDFVIQVGCPKGDGTGGPGFTINAEFNDRKHVAGILSMARTQDPNSAGSQFFLCLGNVPHLDGQYTVFGKTADQESLDVVMKVGSMPTDPSDRPVEEVSIKRGTVVEKPK